MGLTKQYLKYKPSGSTNLIASSKCNAVFVVLDHTIGQFVAVGGCEQVYVWDLRRRERKLNLAEGDKSVTTLAASPKTRQLAAGYEDGWIRIFDLNSSDCLMSIHAHTSEVTTLAYDKMGHRLVSGSKDTEVKVWDVVAAKGLCKLSGHKGPVTKVAFMQDYDIIISSSKDTYIKFWDIETEYNFETLTGHTSEVYGFALVRDDKFLVTSCKDNHLSVWCITESNSSKDGLKFPLSCIKIGTIARKGKGYPRSLISDVSGQVVACHGVNNCIEAFYFLGEDELKKKTLLLLETTTKKSKLYESILKDLIIPLPIVSTKEKVKSLDITLGRDNELRICSVLSNNIIELDSMTITDNDSEAQQLKVIELEGHRTDIRSVAFSSDDLAFATASEESIKLWNRPTLMCLRTVEVNHCVSLVFAPGDKYIVAGSKTGKVIMIDVWSREVLEEIVAHETEIWSTILIPNRRGVVTASGDKTVKFWQFEFVEDKQNETKAKVLSLIHNRTLKLDEGALCVRISSNCKLIAVSLLDCSVKIFFMDTLKFFTTLYGHKLPILSMDISDDSKLIVTGSADRNIKIWGLDFGDCHKSLFAHDDTVTGVAFVPRTHYFFSCGKDGKVKEWDADSFNKIVTLSGHRGQAHYCTVSPNGKYVVSCGSDRTIRLYEKSDELLVLEDQAEEEREKEEDEAMAGESALVQGQKKQPLPTFRTANSVRATELISECLETSRIYLEESSKSQTQLPMMMKFYKVETVEDFMLEILKKIKTNDLEEALYLLSYTEACQIIKMLPKLMQNPCHLELVAKVAVSLLKAHHDLIVNSQILLPHIEEIEKFALQQTLGLRDRIGFNLHGETFMQRVIQEKEGLDLAAPSKKSIRKKKMKQKVGRILQ